jgi:hypothetical protein
MNEDIALRIASNYGYESKVIETNDKGERFNVDSKGSWHKIKKISHTDGQAYIGLERYRDIMIGLGRWTQAMEDSVPDLIRGTADAGQLRLVMQPIKPFLFDHNVTGGTVFPVQHKNSEYLLLPQMAKGNKELQAILEGMGHTFGPEMGWDINKRRFHTAQSSEAVKVGKNDRNVASDVTKIDSQHINTIKNESYRMQVETPAHHIDYNGLIGSQIRKLTFGDMDMNEVFPNGMTGRELYTLWNDLFNADLDKSLDKIKEELYGEGDASIEAISKILTEQALKLNLGEDFIDAVSIVEDENGNKKTKLPLNFPTIIDRVESVVTSRFRDGITKRRANGGSFINASSYGLNKDLSIKWNDDGSIKHFEAILPAWSKKFVNKDGMFDFDLLTEEAKEALLYRIPSEDFYSMFKIKAVGFAPAESGGAVMLPLEVTTISGLDFDIDKVFAMFYALEKNEEGKYGKVKFKKKSEVSKYNYLKRTPGARQIFLKNNPEIKELQEDVDNLLELIDLYEGGEIEQFKMMAGDNATYNQLFDDYEKLFDELESKKKESSAEVLDLMSDEEYAKLTDSEVNTQEARDNMKLDIILTVLSSKSALKKQLDPGGYDILDAAIEELGLGKDDESKDIDDVSDLSDTHQQNMAGNDLVGIVANASVSHSVLQHIDLTLKNAILINNKKYDKVDPNITQQDPNQDRVSKVIASILAAVLDNSKDPKANKLNLDTYTVNAYLALIRVGVPFIDVARFMNQPVIREFVEIYRTNGANKEAERIAKKAIKKKYDINAKLKGAIKIDSSDSIGTTFLNFERVLALGNKIGNLTTALRFDTMSDSRVSDYVSVVDSYEQLGDMSNTFKGIEKLDENLGYLKKMYEHGIVEVLKYLDEKTANPFASKDFSELIRTINDRIPGRLTKDEIHFMSRDLLSAATMGHSFFQEDKGEILSSLASKIEILKRKGFVDKYKILGHLAYVPVGNSTTPFPELIAININKSVPKSEIQAIKDSWVDMLNNEATADIAKDLFKYSVIKSGFSKSNGSIANLIPTALVTEVRDENGNSFGDLYSDELKLIASGLSDDQSLRYYTQYVKNNYKQLRYVPLVKEGILASTESNEKGIVSKIVLPDEWVRENIARSMNDQKFVPDYVKMKTLVNGEEKVLLYENSGGFTQTNESSETPMSTAQYTLVNALGSGFSNKEYNLREDFNTMYEENMVTDELIEAYSRPVQEVDPSLTHIRKVLSDADIAYYNNEYKSKTGRSGGNVFPLTLKLSKGLKQVLRDRGANPESAFWQKVNDNDPNDPRYSLAFTPEEIEMDEGGIQVDTDTGETFSPIEQFFIDELSDVNILTGEKAVSAEEVIIEEEFNDKTSEEAIAEITESGYFEIKTKELENFKGEKVTVEYLSPIEEGSDNKFESVAFSPINIVKILKSEKTTTLRTDPSKAANIQPGESKIIKIAGHEFKFTNRGLMTVEEAGGVEAINKTNSFKGGPMFKHTKDFLEGKRKLHVYDIVPLGDTEAMLNTAYMISKSIRLKQAEQDSSQEVALFGVDFDIVDIESDESRLTKSEPIHKGYNYFKLEVGSRMYNIAISESDGSMQFQQEGKNPYGQEYPLREANNTIKNAIFAKLEKDNKKNCG